MTVHGVGGVGGTHYDALGVPATASADDIRVAYRRAMRRHHPDLVGSSGAEMTAKLTHAFAEIGDDDRRREYDQSLAALDAAEDAGEPEAWGEVVDEHVSEWGVPFNPPAAQRRHKKVTLVGWGLIALGALGATSLWTLNLGGPGVPSGAGVIPFVLGLSILSAMRWNFAGAATALWQLRTSNLREGTGWLATLVAWLGRVVLCGAGAIVLRLNGWLGAVVLGCIAVGGPLADFGWLSGGGLVTVVCGGLLARYAGIAAPFGPKRP